MATSISFWGAQRREGQSKRKRKKEKYMKEKEELNEMICDKDFIIRELKEKVNDFEELSFEIDNTLVCLPSSTMSKYWQRGWVGS